MRDAPDSELLMTLEAIDAALHDEPVDPELADLAELSLILRDERPRPDPVFLAALDARAAARFAPPPRVRARPRRAWWAAGTALAGIATVVLVLVLAVHPGRPRVSGSSGGSSTVSSGATAAAAPGGSAKSSSASAGSSGSSGSSVSAGSSSPSRSSAAGSPGPAPVPRGARGRDLTQSARLVLRARPGHIDGVAQQVYDVVGAEHGFVEGSHVLARAGGAGSARFTLSVPSARLQATLTRLSALGGASVVSRADASADVTSAVDTTAQRLADARALRGSLLRRLAVADSAGAAARLLAQLRTDAATISADGAALARLHTRVADSAITVAVTAAPAARSGGVAGRRSGGFTLHRALHDAGRILVVAAGILLIALAVLLPLGLLVAVAAWVWARTLARRREGALGP